MPLVAAKCTDCGGVTEVDSEKKAAVCQSCGNAFIVEEAINHFNNTYFNTTNIKDSVVHIHEAKSKDFVIKAGVLEKYFGESRDVVIPDSVVEIASGALQGMLITSVTIPDSVTRIGGCAFCDCTSLVNITLPSSVTYIGFHAFSGCTKLANIIMPNSVAQIEHFAFYRCESLVTITIPDSVVRIGAKAFADCSKLANVKMSSKMLEKAEVVRYNSYTENDYYHDKYEKMEAIFYGTPFFEKQKRAFEEKRRATWIAQGLCQHCGGKIGFFGKCKSCGK